MCVCVCCHTFTLDRHKIRYCYKQMNAELSSGVFFFAIRLSLFALSTDFFMGKSYRIVLSNRNAKTPTFVLYPSLHHYE